MKRYCHNKGFIPSSFIDKKNNINIKSDKRGLIILVIVAFILFTISIDKIIRKEEIFEPYYKMEDESVDKNDILIWYDIMEDGTDGVITDKLCKLNVYDKDILNKICKKEKFSINTIDSLGDNKYILDIIKEN